MVQEESSVRLVHQSKHKYGVHFESHILEQYKLYVQSADNVSARRLASTRYCLTLNTALVAIYGFHNEPQFALLGRDFWPIVIPTIGVFAAIVWYQIIKSHSDLNTVKFKIVHDIEKQLPAALYDYEWELLQEGKGKTYSPVSKIEQWIPIVFLVIYAIIFLGAILDLPLIQQTN